MTVEEKMINISSQALLLSDYEDASSEGTAPEIKGPGFSFPRSKVKSMITIFKTIV